MKRITSLIALLCAAGALTGAARAGISIGVSEDRARGVDPVAFFATLGDVGLTQNRASLTWDPAAPNVIPAQDQIQAWLPLAQAAGVRVIFSVGAKSPRDLSSADAPAQFAAWVAHVSQTFPQVKDYVVGNEPNQPYFWQPQFDEAGRPLSAAAYEPVLADTYDALKALDPTINVIGIGLSPRGNDNPHARSNISRSPVRFLHDLGVAYRTSGRNKPLMDELAYHPYPAKNTDAPNVGYPWPNAGLPNLDRLKQAVWDAFNGTAQPTFDETAYKSFAPPLRLQLDELGWQVAVLPSLAGLYFGTETIPSVDEATQAQNSIAAIQSAECDPAVLALDFFLLVDEPDLSHWQSGLERIDGSHRPSYDAVKQTIAQTHGDCQGATVVWRHSTHVSLPFVKWGNLRHVRPLKTKRWSFVAGAREESTFRAGIFKAGTSRKAIARALAGRRPKPLLRASGMIKAKNRVVVFPARRLKRGRYIFAVRLMATMNPNRTTQLVSRPFRVGTRGR
jgi:hypothetical protein